MCVSSPLYAHAEACMRGSAFFRALEIMPDAFFVSSLPWQVVALSLACVTVQLSLLVSPSHHMYWSAVVVVTQLLRIVSGSLLVLQQFFVWQQGASGLLHVADLLLFMRIKTAFGVIHQAVRTGQPAPRPQSLEPSVDTVPFLLGRVPCV
ncbi:Zinc finger (C3HC4 type, RING finger) protein,related [Neospora caninum Liverpool]|uniref:Zinc finger (C3HC4 type, RING finger) protein,related n=1 Tax=Neospora caninum (strain Liverpool) TaxID=572307 RepID=F0VHN9_NEOCL|nr:Zinc finger (C3HC4 type, RING finger) protein,related [Neospora caninum Liverpool]CBZ53250.1 Zinc finger (C3HC4 type, RING finger) protein,related [Neospora caninum Liverpool]|eukprot:XP_003883282.1 Zinc finger (C3HC4 type, RING finger) protein,related [Neospora caninum Liverpool]